MSSYSAIVTAITVRPHPNADRLLLGNVAGHQVVVGLGTVNGDLGVFFPTDGALSAWMCAANDLFSESACQKLGLANTVYGYFSANGRVRSQLLTARWKCATPATSRALGLGTAIDI